MWIRAGYLSVVIATVAAMACQEMGGVATVNRELAERYGSENAEVELTRENGRSRVDITVRDPSFGEPAPPELRNRAREIGRIAVREVALEGERDSVTVTLAAEEERGALEASRGTTFRFSAKEFR